MGWFYDLFWKESLWLPEGFTWKDLESTPTVKKAEIKDLYYIPLWVISILIIRYVFERYIATPFCKQIGIKNSVKHIDGEKVTNYSYRKEQKVRQKLKKATESCWRFTFYFGIFCYGSFVLFRTEWFWDNSKWYPGFMKEHEFTWDMKLYYLLELSFYFSLLVSQFVDTRRRDFYQLFIHHITTVILLLISYILSLYRFGSIIMYIHDAADIWLEAAKITNYAKIQKVCDMLFTIFGIVFFLTRLVYYPIWVAYGYFRYKEYTHGIIHNLLVVLCYLLLMLHIFWGRLIAKMAYKLVIVGKVEKDTRSESEDSD